MFSPEVPAIPGASDFEVLAAAPVEAAPVVLVVGAVELVVGVVDGDCAGAPDFDLFVVGVVAPAAEVSGFAEGVVVRLVSVRTSGAFEFVFVDSGPGLVVDCAAAAADKARQTIVICTKDGFIRVLNLGAMRPAGATNADGTARFVSFY